MPRAAVVQLNSTDQVADNLVAARALLEQAANAGAVLAVLPENFALMGSTEYDKLAVAEGSGHGPIQAWLAQTARELNIWIVAGTLPLRVDAQRVAAASLVMNAKGECVARYDKIHLFDVMVAREEAVEDYRESATIAAGTHTTVVDTPIGRIGLAVCYDLRFPELFRALMRQGAEIFCVPAAFTATTGRAHWEVLTRARAVENLSYLLAATQVGSHRSGRETYGHAVIVDGWGAVLGTCVNTPGIVMAEIDLQHLHALRQQFPALQHQRAELFAQ